MDVIQSEDAVLTIWRSVFWHFDLYIHWSLLGGIW